MEMDIRKRLGKNIRGLRVAYGETQEKLSEAIGYSKNAVSIMRTESENQSKTL